MKKILASLRALTKNSVLYIIADGFYYAGYSVVNVFLSALITNNIAPGRIDLVGFVVGYYMFLRAATEIPISRFTRKLSPQTKKQIISIGYVVYGILVIFLGHASFLAQIFLIQTIVGLIDASVYPIKWPIFAKAVDKEEELTWGLEDLSATLLPAVFTVLAGVLSAAFGIAAAFLLFGTLLIVSGVLFAFMQAGSKLVSEKQRMILKKLVDTLRSGGIPFQITGGLAAIIYGAHNRPLYDIDIEVYGKDIPKVVELFKGSITQEFGRYKDEQFDIQLLTIEIEGVPIDVTQAENERVVSPQGELRVENANVSAAQMMTFLDLHVPVESRANLISYKKFIARPTDLKDAEEIELKQ